jgi:hypothetical protein
MRNWRGFALPFPQSVRRLTNALPFDSERATITRGGVHPLGRFVSHTEILTNTVSVIAGVSRKTSNCQSNAHSQPPFFSRNLSR